MNSGFYYNKKRVLPLQHSFLRFTDKQLNVFLPSAILAATLLSPFA